MSAGVLVMLEMMIACSAVIVVAGVLWIRPWIDDHKDPYG
jgi:hypothetical protein